MPGRIQTICISTFKKRPDKKIAKESSTSFEFPGNIIDWVKYVTAWYPQLLLLLLLAHVSHHTSCIENQEFKGIFSLGFGERPAGSEGTELLYALMLKYKLDF